MELRESTITTVKFGPFLGTDGITEKTALTPTIRLSKNSGTPSNRSSATAVNHSEFGYYNVPLDATDTNTRGILRVMARDGVNHVPVWQDFAILSDLYWDEKYAAPLTLQAGSASTATLDAGASSVDAYYAGVFLALTAGTGAGQVRRILGYTGATKVAQVDTPWLVNPAAGTRYRLIANASAYLSAAGEANLVNTLMTGATGFVETGYSFKDSMRYILSGAAAKTSGAQQGSSTFRIRDINDTKDRLVFLCDAFGNRVSVITRDAT